jgi:hypothetical protein
VLRDLPAYSQQQLLRQLVGPAAHELAA